MLESNVSVETDRESTRKHLHRARCPIEKEKKNYFFSKTITSGKEGKCFRYVKRVPVSGKRFTRLNDDKNEFKMNNG